MPLMLDWGCDVPSSRHLFQFQGDRQVSSLSGVDENFTKVKKCVLRIELRAIRPRSVCVNVVFDYRATFGAVNQPRALIESRYS